jgi:hypothetical protein
MRDRQPMESRVFGPKILCEITRAFDTAWSEIAHHFGDADADVARSRLAQAVLIVAADYQCRDTDDLKTESLQVLALTYRSRWPLAWH